MRNRAYFDGGDVMVIKNIDRYPECFVVYSSKGGVYRWWEYPATDVGYREAVATAEAVAGGRMFPPPCEEMVYGD